MTAVLSDLYLSHEWVVWILLFWRILAGIGRVAFAVITWFPRIILTLIGQQPSLIIEIVAMLSAMLLAVWTRDADVGLPWKVLSSVLGVWHLAVLVAGSVEGRVKVMIISTVFWLCLAFAFLPRRFVLAHVFLIPLCWAYIVTTLALLRQYDDRRN